MTVYTAPQRDMRFVLHEFLNVEQLAELPGYEDATADTIDAIIEESSKLAEGLLFPLNQSGDQEGCVFENGVVRTPEGFKEAYDQFTEACTSSIACASSAGSSASGIPALISSMCAPASICAMASDSTRLKSPFFISSASSFRPVGLMRSPIIVKGFSKPIMWSRVADPITVSVIDFFLIKPGGYVARHVSQLLRARLREFLSLSIPDFSIISGTACSCL